MRVESLNEVKTEDGLCFQYCKWHWDDREPTYGYRFIWRKSGSGKLLPTRGQAYIPDGATMLDLISRAVREGWFQ